MKAIFNVLALPFMWLYATVTGPMLLPKITIILLFATVIYLIVQLYFVSNIGGNYYYKVRGNVRNENPEPDINDRNYLRKMADIEAKFKKTLNEDHFYRMLMVIKPIARFLACAVYAGIVCYCLHDFCVTELENEITGTIASIVIGFIASGVVVVLWKIIFGACERIDLMIYHVKSDYTDTQKKAAKRKNRNM